MSTPLSSMTGFARVDGGDGPLSWSWELRSVNGRGLDLRFRLPPGLDRIEPQLRDAAQRLLRRGNVTANLTLRREQAQRIEIDRPLLDQLLAAAIELAGSIPGAAPPRAEALLAMSGVLRTVTTERVADGQDGDVVLDGFQTALEELLDMRRAEGARLAATLTGLLGEIAALVATARAEASDQPAQQRARMLDSLAALLRDASGLPEERIAQEVALLASRADVREELDRLESHIGAAHALLSEGALIGRRFDFLIQEFSREANTLCSKSASAALTATGLRLKSVIEQLREQVQNIE